MYVVTNRVLHEKENGLGLFGKEPNPSGPNELRIVEVTGDRRPRAKALTDKLDVAEVRALKKRHGLTIDENADWYASLRVACELHERATTQRKHLLFFVHGYNNDIEDVITTARELESLYGVIVVPFSWPANGGGKISGTAAYLSDKDDARSSATALHRFVQKAHAYHTMLSAGMKQRLLDIATRRFPNTAEKAQALFVKLVEKECPTTVNLLCHSMGNYVLKYGTLSSSSSLRSLAFDNIALVAADANNPGHESWVEALPVRNRLYVVINENDGALKWSRRKPGDEQKERLGHHLRNLVARNACYIDITRNRGVGSEHSYFKGDTVKQNAKLRGVFRRIFEGGRAEESLTYHPDINVYRS